MHSPVGLPQGSAQGNQPEAGMSRSRTKSPVHRSHQLPIFIPTIIVTVTTNQVKGNCKSKIKNSREIQENREIENRSEKPLEITHHNESSQAIEKANSQIEEKQKKIGEDKIEMRNLWRLSVTLCLNPCGGLTCHSTSSFWIRLQAILLRAWKTQNRKNHFTTKLIQGDFTTEVYTYK